MSIAWHVLKDLEEAFEGVFAQTPKWQLIFGTVILTTGLSWLVDLINHREDIIPSVKSWTFKLLRKVPALRKQIEEEMAKAKADIQKSMYEPEERTSLSFMELPAKGKTREEIIELANKIFKIGKFEWNKGKVSGAIMTAPTEEYNSLMVKMFEMFTWTNPLHSDIFPGVRKMEAEVVRMTAKIFHGGDDVVGSVTLGGTESLVMMMKAYRDYGRRVKGITNPELVAPVTVHAAVEKGAHILGYKFRKVKTHPRTTKSSIADIEKAINKNTVLLVASAPDFAHGTIDDIEEMSALGLKYDIPLHIDACLGGFILPFMDAAGFPLKPFDFRVPGVTSISADTHKFGYAPKGSSVILYRDKKFIHHQYFVTPDWPGGIYATATIPGSRAGVNIAMCWAALLYHGYQGYVEKTRRIITVASEVRDQIKQMDDLFVYGDPLGPVVSFGSEKFNIVQVSDTMAELGWHLQPIQNPVGMHVFFTANQTAEGVAKQLISDLKKAIAIVKANPNTNEGWAKIYGLTQSLPDKSLIVDMVKLYLDIFYTSATEK